jgi:hypothetical protein
MAEEVMEEIELTPEQFDKMNDESKVKYLTAELGSSAKLLIEGHYLVSEYSDRYEDLSQGVVGLLNFVKERFPDDFKEGGKGFTCPHHKRLAAHVKRWSIK